MKVFNTAMVSEIYEMKERVLTDLEIQDLISQYQILASWRYLADPSEDQEVIEHCDLWAFRIGQILKDHKLAKSQPKKRHLSLVK